jgi:hypothetical protein
MVEYTVILVALATSACPAIYSIGMPLVEG